MCKGVEARKETDHENLTLCGLHFYKPYSLHFIITVYVLCAYACVCMCMGVWVLIYVYVCEVCTRTCVYGNADVVCWFVYINVRMCVCVYKYACVYICVCACEGTFVPQFRSGVRERVSGVAWLHSLCTVITFVRLTHICTWVKRRAKEEKQCCSLWLMGRRQILEAHEIQWGGQASILYTNTPEPVMAEASRWQWQQGKVPILASLLKWCVRGGFRVTWVLVFWAPEEWNCH